MKLLNEIIEIATDSDVALAMVLRKLTILAYELGNDRLKLWTSSELDGYEDATTVPDYRKVKAIAKGLFVGYNGSTNADQPLAPSRLKPEHRHFAEELVLWSGIGGYEHAAKTMEIAGSVAWPPDLTLLYQNAFFDGWALNRAWQEIPKSVFIHLVDTVRNRALRFALELRDELGAADDDVKAIPPAKVDQTVQTFIYGGTNIITGTAHGFSQIGSITVSAGDIAALTAVLSKMGFTGSEIADLQLAVAADKAEQSAPGLGKRAAAWLGKIGTTIGTTALNVGIDVARAEVTKALSGFFGIG